MVKNTKDPAAKEDEIEPCQFGTLTIQKTVGVLSNPRVSFISLVGHAANGLPFAVVKNEEGIAVIEPPDPDSDMSKQTTAPIPSFGKPGSEVSLHKIEFPKTAFADEEAVKAFLTENGITARRIDDKDTMFVVPSAHESAFESVEAVKGEGGVTFHVGKLKAPSQASVKPRATTDKGGKTVNVAKDDAPVVNLRGDEPEGTQEEETPEGTDTPSATEEAPLDAEVIKFDSWVARNAGTQTLDATLGSGEDGNLPGLYDLIRAIEVTVQNIVKKAPADQVASRIQAACTRGGEVISKLAGVFVSVSKGEEATIIEIDRPSLVKHFSSPAPQGEGVVVQKSEGTTAPEESEQQQEEQQPETPTPTQVPDAGTLAEVMKTALLPALEEVVKKSVSAEIGTVNERLLDLEQVRQTQKSLPGDAPVEVEKSEDQKEAEVRKAERLARKAEEDKKDQEFAHRSLRSKLGALS